MPTVPRPERQVTANRMPGVQAPEAPGFQPFDTRAADRTMSEAEKLYLAERRKANQLAVLDADRQLSETATRLQYDPEAGFYNMRGKDAFRAPDYVEAEWRKQVEAIEKGFANDTQREAFRNRVMARWGDLDRQLQRHVSAEGRKYDDAVTESWLANERDAAAFNYHDPERVAISIESQRAAIVDYADRNGLPAEWVKEKAAGAVSKTHVAVIQRMLANGQDLDAKAYYDANGEEVTGSDTISLEKSLAEGTLRGESQRRAAEIAAKDLSRAEAIEEARKIKDPEVKDATVSRVKTIYEEREAAEKEALEDLYIEAVNLVEQSPGRNPRDVVAPDVWTRLTVAQRNALESRSGGRSNDDDAWLDFFAMSPAEMGGLNKAEFETRYWSKFDNSHRSRAEAMWMAAREGRNIEMSSLLTFKARVTNAWEESGRGKKEKSEKKDFARFESEAARRVELFELNDLEGKRKATGEEVQTIIDDMVTRKVFVEEWGRDPEKPAVLVTEDERENAYVPYGDIPEADRNSIENLLKSNGKVASKDKIQRAYAAYLMEDLALFDSIIGE